LISCCWGQRGWNVSTRRGHTKKVRLKGHNKRVKTWKKTTGFSLRIRSTAFFLFFTVSWAASVLSFRESSLTDSLDYFFFDHRHLIFLFSRKDTNDRHHHLMAWRPFTLSRLDGEIRRFSLEMVVEKKWGEEVNRRDETQYKNHFYVDENIDEVLFEFRLEILLQKQGKSFCWDIPWSVSFGFTAWRQCPCVSK
jgi:hypothetical protein